MQSKLNWFWEGDANLKFFHGLMSSKGRSNAIIKININDLQVEGVNNVRNALFNHFETHFQSSVFVSLSVNNLNFKSNNMVVGGLG